MASRVTSIVEMRRKRIEETKNLERMTALGMAAVLMALGLSRRSLPGFLLAGASVPFLYRGLSGGWPLTARADDDTRVALAGDRGVHVREAVRIEKPVEEVYRFWRRFENLPRFMINLDEVTERPDGRWTWVARDLAGRPLSWDVEIINEVENKVIGWRSLPGSDVVTAGSVNFAPVRGGQSTQVSVHLQYAPPAGKWGARLGKLVGREPSRMIREDLRRLKQILETGEIARASAHESTGE